MFVKVDVFLMVPNLKATDMTVYLTSLTSPNLQFAVIDN